jgi:hypothetical protein
MDNKDKKLSKSMKNVLRNINECLCKIAKQNNMNHSLEKIEFLEKEGFYNDYPDNLFVKKYDEEIE